MVRMVVGSFSKSRLFPPLVPPPETVPLEVPPLGVLPELPPEVFVPELVVPPLTQLLPVPFFTTMVWGVGLRT